MAKTNHRWVRATKGCRSIRALAQRIKDKIPAKQPSVDALANYIREGRLAWFAERADYVAVLHELTGLPPHVLLGTDGEKVAFKPLQATEFDAADEDPASLTEETPLMWLDDGGVSIAEVPSGCGRQMWAHIVERRRRAVVREVATVAELESDMSREPVLALVDRVDLAGDADSLRRLVRTGRRVVLLARCVEQSGGQPGEGPKVRIWKLVADWRERLVRFLCARMRLKQGSGRPLAERAISILRETDGAMISVATPGDVVEMVALLQANQRRWSALFLTGDDDAGEGALSELLRLRGFEGKKARQLERELRAALEQRATRLDLPLHGPLSEEDWQSLGVRDLEELLASGLLRRRGGRVAVFPEVVARNEVRRRLGALVGGNAPWGHLCADAGRRAEVGVLLTGMSVPEIEKTIREALAQAPDALESVGRLDALYSEIGRRFMKRDLGRSVELVGDPALLEALFLRATTTWAHRYAGGDGVPCPVTRPAFYGSGEECSAFVGECWAWSFSGVRIAQVDGRFQGLFPGWQRLSWTNPPEWWSQIDARSVVDRDEDDKRERLAEDALLTYADRIVMGLAGDVPLAEAIPPILLVPVADRLAPLSRAARDLFQYVWPGCELAKRRPAVAWRLAILTFGVEEGYRWLENIDAPMISDRETEAIIGELSNEALSSVEPTRLPKALRAPILWRWSRDVKLQSRLGAVLGTLVEQRLASASELALVIEIAATQAAWLGESLLRALWKGKPERAFERLWEALSRDAAVSSEIERLVMTAPPRERERVFAALEGRALTDPLRNWLLRSIIEAPAGAERAWELLSASRRDGQKPTSAS